MSWKDRINDKMVIKTGDDKTYNLSWRPGGKKIDYNVASFEFPNIEGTLVVRKKAKGTQHEINVVFQGENHLQDYEAFEISCRSEKQVEITHPMYGLLTVQITGLKINNSDYNITDAKLEAIETISSIYPQASVSLVDAIAENKDVLNTAVVDSTTNISSAQVSTQQSFINKYNAAFDVLTKLDEEKEALINLTNKAKTAVADAISKPAKAIESVINLINFPADVTAGLNSIFSVFENTLIDLLLVDLDVLDNKFLYEKNGGSVIGSICLVSSIKASADFETKAEVLDYIQSFLTTYNNYIEQLDSMQTERGDSPESYVPDFDALYNLDNLVNLTISNLFAIAFAAKQERSILLDADSNIILLTDKYYGLNANDDNIDKFIKTNNIGISEMLLLKKGREIIYYI